MKVSEADARRWLELWGYTFALELKDIVFPHLHDLFHRATLRDTNQAFTRLYTKALDAIFDAGDIYAQKVGMENRSSGMT